MRSITYQDTFFVNSTRFEEKKEIVGISHSLSEPLTNQSTILSLTFSPIQTEENFFVSVSLPNDFDAKNVDVLNDITGIDNTCQLFKDNFGQEDEPKWVVFEKCTTINEEPLKFQFSNLINPIRHQDTGAFSIQLFKIWNEEPQQVFADSKSYLIPYSDFIVSVVNIREAKIETSSNILGEKIENVATISFTPVNPLSI